MPSCHHLEILGEGLLPPPERFLPRTQAAGSVPEAGMGFWAVVKYRRCSEPPRLENEVVSRRSKRGAENQNQPRHEAGRE